MIIMTLGGLGYFCGFLTVVTGILKAKLIIHKSLAAATVFFATAHVLYVLYVYFTLMN